MSSDHSDLTAPALSQGERQILLLQHQILANLDQGEREHHERMVEVLTEGFTIEYGNVFTPYSDCSESTASSCSTSWTCSG